MVKSVVTIIITVIFLTVGAIFEQTYILKEFEEFSIITKTMIVKAENETATEEDIINLQKNWEEKKRYLHAFIPHNEIKEIGLWISEAIAFTKYENYEELTDKLKVLYDLSVQVPNQFLVRFENIF